jgi:hypothetical protein
MSKKINIRLNKEAFEEIKETVNFENVIIEDNAIEADADSLQLEIALHKTGWSQSDNINQIYKEFEKTIKQLEAFRTLLNDECARAMLSDLDIEMLERDSEGLSYDIKNLLYLFEF